MGKRKRAPAIQQKAIWDHDSEIALLGLLDFCIKHKHTFPFKQQFVTGRLYPTGLPHEPYTWEQVKRKLFSLWGKYGEDDSPNKEEILKKGSACFAKLAITADEKIQIKTEVERLEEELKPRNFLSVRESPVIREATVVSSFTIESCGNSTCDENPKIKNSQTPRSQRYQTRELSILSRKRTETPNYISLEDETPKKQPRHAEKVAQNRYKKHRQQENVGNEDLDKPELGLFRIEDEKESKTTFLVPHDADNFTPLRPSNHIQPSKQDPRPSIAGLERMNKAALGMKDEKITELEERIILQDEKIIELRNKLDSFRAVQNGDAQKIVFHLTQEVQSLKMAKEEYLRTCKFAALNGNYGAARKKMNMKVQIVDIRHHMRNIIGGFDDDIVLQCPGPKPTVVLGGLLSFGFGLEEHVPWEKDQFQEFLSNHTPYTIIETLMEAAVCTWVLESSFPDFAQQTGSFDLSATYRKLLATQGDSVALRSLDLASHYDLINTPRFQKLLNEEAETLSSSLAKTLSPFFPRDIEESENNLFETWGEDELTWKERRGCMVDMFKDSLMMKSNSLLTPERYELINYPPGSLFDPLSMEVYGRQGVILTGGGSIVAHCLHVAIQAIAGEEVKDGASVEEATVQPKNFIRVTDGKNSGVPSATILVKAVVILREPEEKRP